MLFKTLLPSFAQRRENIFVQLKGIGDGICIKKISSYDTNDHTSYTVDQETPQNLSGCQ